jgi:hypothetical protein
VSEVLSGKLPLQNRKLFNDLISGVYGKMKVYVESARAVARSTLIAEEAWAKSKASGVEIIPADAPDLFQHSPSPALSFMRKVISSCQEFERDVITHRLSHAQQARKDIINLFLKAKAPRNRSQAKAGRSAGRQDVGPVGGQDNLKKDGGLAALVGKVKIRVDQQGHAKVSGAYSILERVKPSKTCLQKIAKIHDRIKTGALSWR